MPPEIVRYTQLMPYQPIWHAMQAFTEQRQADTPDQIWLLQHTPVYTLGLAGKREHLLNTGPIPVLAIDRGGQVTYHGPGQWIAYVLLDLKRRGWGVKHLVSSLEQSVIDLLAAHGVHAVRRDKAPGVYVKQRKIAALGLRVRRGCSYHGLSLNVNMDLSPFQGINPCGYQGLEVTQLCDEGVKLDMPQAGEALLACVLEKLIEVS